METFAVAAGLVLIGVLDAMFAGFRASCGRTGLVEHRKADLLAARRGLGIGSALVAPIGVAVVVDAGANDRTHAYVDAGRAMLTVFAPYGALVLLALAAYGSLHWRKRFLASAILLGPLTLIRPLVAAAGAVVAMITSGDMRVALFAFAAVAAVLAVEPLTGRLWYSTTQ